MVTNEQLAEALGLNVRTIERDRLRGLPLPADGEDLAAWATRTRAWRKATRKAPGPRPRVPSGAPEALAMTRFRTAKAELAELELAERRRQLHSQQQCEELHVRRLQDLMAAFQLLPDRMARRLYQAPSPDFIKLQLTQELRRCFEVLSNGDVSRGLDAGDAECSPVAHSADGERVGGSEHRPAGA